MMRYIWPIISLFLAAGIQGNLPMSISIFGAMPDLVLVVLIAYALAQDPEFGVTLGFIAGLIHGCSVGLTVGSFIATRAITGFIAGLVSTRLFSENAIVPTFSVLWLTAVCGGLFQLFNPRLELSKVLGILAGQCILNAIFTFLLYLTIRQFDNRRKNKLVNARL